MKTLYSILLFASFFTQATESNIHDFFDGTLSIALSTDLKKLSNSSLNRRYNKQKIPPAFAFSNKEKTVSFTFTKYSTPADKKSMNKIHKSISIMLRKSSDNAKWKKDKVYNRLGTKVAVYEYEIKAVAKYQYNLTYALPVNGQLTFISFITTDKKYKKKWLSLARESMDSIQLIAL